MDRNPAKPDYADDACVVWGYTVCMPQKTDLYSILQVYARKNKTPLIQVNVFIDFLGKYARGVYHEKPEWACWAVDTDSRVWEALLTLQEEDKLSLSGGEDAREICLYSYYADPLEAAYKNPEKTAALPFPDEKAINMPIPVNLFICLSVETDISGFLAKTGATKMPLKLIFPHNYGETLVLASMLPLTVLEHCFAKLKHYLKQGDNKTYLQNKLAAQLACREELLEKLISRIMTNFKECINDLLTGWESILHFWFFFCNYIKNDLRDKKVLQPEEKGALQAACLVEICSVFFKARAAKAKETALALKVFEDELEKPPYYFSREMIRNFRDTKGVLLLELYTQEELEAHIKQLASDASGDELPELMYFRDEYEELWLITKKKMLLLCIKLLVEARPVVIQSIFARWKKMLLDFRKEAAMDNDKEFETLVNGNVQRYVPMLDMLLGDPRLFLVYGETQDHEKELPEASRLFSGSALLPLRSLLLLSRKEILRDIKLLLPFWYNIPVICKIAAFFQNFGRKRKRPAAGGADAARVQNAEKEAQKPALEEELRMIPEGYTVQSYLAELAGQWGKLMQKSDMDRLVRDVNVIVRDKLRYMLRTRKPINKDNLELTAGSIIASSPGLSGIPDQKALVTYIKVYLVSLLSEKA